MGSAVAPGWEIPELVGTSGTASTAPAPTTSTWSTAPAGQRTDATRPPALAGLTTWSSVVWPSSVLCTKVASVYFTHRKHPDIEGQSGIYRLRRRKSSILGVTVLNKNL